MTVETLVVAPPDDELLDPADPVGHARAHVAAGALTPTDERRVGLELEFHLLDLDTPLRRPTWAAIQLLVDALPTMPSGSSVTLEPGGQIELSTPVRPDVSSAVQALRADRAALRSALADVGYGAVPLGADLARPVRRTNPGARYVAMEQHFAAIGCEGPGRSMMSSTAALQVNLDAGPAAGWTERLALVRSLVPLLVALSSSSPWLGGRTSGWHSMRQETWHGIDHGRSDPIATGEPTSAWSAYALAAPVMLIRGEVLRPVADRISFAEWLREPRLLGRPATLADLDYHLTTLFPPVRPRGYVEIRCIDSLPDRWWPALAAIAVTLVDHPLAAEAATEVCAPVAGAWESAARTGLADPDLRSAAASCLELAALHCPPDLTAEVEEFAELVASGRTPSSDLRARVERDGALHVLEEEARA